MTNGASEAAGAAPPDEELVRRAGAGDRAAFAALVGRHGDALFRFARRACGSAADAEDALQDGLVAAWRGAATFRGEARARTWLFQIVLHAARRRGRRRAGEPAGHEPLDAAAAIPSGAAGPEARTVARETGAALERALAELPADAAEVLMLRDVAGLSGEETAEVLGLALPAMKSRLHRARLELKARVEAVVGGLACGEVLDRLSDYLDDELEPRARAQVEEHLRGCDRCARFGGELGRTIRALKAHLERSDRLPDALRERLLGALDDDDR